jgi:hypothetical protein
LLAAKTKTEVQQAWNICKSEIEQCEAYHKALLDYAKKFKNENPTIIEAY